MSRERFVEFVQEGILSLAQDLKSMLRIVDDPEVEDEDRVAAAGALLHVLSAANAIPGMRGLLAYVDDVLVLRLVLERLEKTSPEAMARHREESPELLKPLHDQLQVMRDYLGECTVVLEQAASSVSKLSYQGHSAAECVHDTGSSNWLYDEVNGAIMEQLEFDEDEVAREAKGVDRILTHLRTRVSAQKP